MEQNTFNCYYCNKEFKFKSLYQRHINKKKSCQNIVDDNNQKIEEINKKYINITQLINNKYNLSIVDKCYFCDKTFSIKSNLIKHKNNYCKNYKKLLILQQNYKELINNNNEITKLKEENKKLQEENNKIVIKNKDNIKDDNNVKTINNNININNNNLHIHLNSFGKEDLSHITDEDYKIYIKTIYNGLVSFIKHIHFSEDNPSNFNIYLDNPRSNSIKIFEDNKWLLKDSNEVITKIKEDKLNILDKKVEEFNDEKLKTKLENYKTRLQDNKDATNMLTNRIKDLLYNNNNDDNIKGLE